MIATGQTLKSSEVDVKGRSLWVDARRRLLKNRAAMAGLIILALVALLALLAPLLSSFAYDEVNYDIIACAPNWWPANSMVVIQPPTDDCLSRRQTLTPRAASNAAAVSPPTPPPTTTTS